MLQEAPPRTAAPAAERNPGIGLELGWLRGVQANLSAVERRAATLTTRRNGQDRRVAARAYGSLL